MVCCTLCHTFSQTKRDGVNFKSTFSEDKYNAKGRSELQANVQHHLDGKVSYNDSASTARPFAIQQWCICNMIIMHSDRHIHWHKFACIFNAWQKFRGSHVVMCIVSLFKNLPRSNAVFSSLVWMVAVSGAPFVYTVKIDKCTCA